RWRRWAGSEYAPGGALDEEKEDPTMARQRMKLTFPPDLMNTPLVYTMGKQFQVVTNIRRANVSGDRGWLAREISGAGEAIERAIDWGKNPGARVGARDSERVQT